MRLKTKRKKSNERDPNVCSVSRCNAEPAIIDATRKHDPDSDVYLCDRHWGQQCDDEDAELEAARAAEDAESEAAARAMLAKAMRLKPGQSLQPGHYVMRQTDEGLEVVT